ncbi:hypothetical protein PILCRDRAFT_817871 [Piloderma croceum F 1598]|uniref:F-box domain-containing protein n=1 Tax=Piloderma croceum (strain F 1598) TaxID=765440 RepID=A0A0C3BFG0_PILCF|nr:hypothetical protein PILCRDRAFT_817871 [Piloderma croceum F 1598]
MSTELPAFEDLAPQVLGRIAFYAGTSSFLGPPTDLFALLSTSRKLYNVLSFTKNKQLWADIFKFKFDTDAAARRLSPRWSTSECQAEEGRKRFAAMRRIRHEYNAVAEQHHLSDLWTAYLMLLESDGRNESQLIEWSDIRRFLYYAIIYRARTPQGSSSLWFVDTEGTALTVWLLWMTANAETTRAEDPQLRAEIRALLHPFVVAGFRYPSIQTPDSHFDLPLCPLQEGIAAHTSGPPPKITTLLHYNHQLTIAAPSLTSAALLAASVRIEAIQDISPLPAVSRNLPPTREIANARGLTGKTLEDVREFQYKVRTRFLERCTLDEDGNESGSSSEIVDSERHDEDWYRLVCCYDPWNDQAVLRGKVWSPGTLSGSWDGRVMIPHTQVYWTMLLNPHIPASTIGVSQDRISFEFQEHHCLYPDEPLTPGTDETECGDDILNAWLPQNIVVRHLEGAIEIQDPVTGRNIRYETFLPNRPLSYSKAACDKLRNSCIPVGDVEEHVGRPSDEGAMPAEHVTPIHDDDAWEDTVEHTSSGVKDILVTGKTSQRQGEAWGHFTILGRVRTWDGLCVFVRTPTNPQESHFGRWIFKGYVHDNRLVGRWRETSTSVENIGWEGGFVMCKHQD